MKYIFLSIIILFASINTNADDVNKIASAYATQTSDLQVSSTEQLLNFFLMTAKVHATNASF
jgi:hypothetical protein